MKIEFKNGIQKTVITGVFTALLAVLSQISIPMPTNVPITLQTFAVALCGFVLGPKLGTLSIAVYLALGAVGVPVLAGFCGGFSFFLGVSGGFLWGFLVMAFLSGLGTRMNKRLVAIALGLAGLVVCHMFGVVQFTLVTTTPLLESFLIMSAPYLIKDVASVIVAYLAAEAVLYSLKKARLVTLG